MVADCLVDPVRQDLGWLAGRGLGHVEAVHVLDCLDKVAVDWKLRPAKDGARLGERALRLEIADHEGAHRGHLLIRPFHVHPLPAPRFRVLVEPPFEHGCDIARILSREHREHSGHFLHEPSPLFTVLRRTIAPTTKQPGAYATLEDHR